MKNKYFAFKIFFTILILLVITSCGTILAPHEGKVQVRGGKIWYKVMGTGSGTPLVVVHGGPGGRSCGYFEGFRKLSAERPIIFFDQLGSGHSDRPGDTSLWKLPYFIEQLDLLRKNLNLKKFHLLGSSWGAAIAIEYMLTKNTKGVKSVIFSGPLLSTPQWIEDAKILLSRLPQSVQDTISKYEVLKDYDADAYLAATHVFYAHFLSRKEWPRKTISADCKNVPGFNAAIYEYMWGPTEFTATGTLKNFDRTDRMHTLKLPVLFIAGEYDEVLPETLSYYQSLVKGSQTAIIPNAAHDKLTDNAEDFIKALRSFLSEIE